MIVWANLDQESRWSGLGLPAHVMTRISYASALVGALVEGPAEIYAPAEIDASKIHLPVTMRVGTPERFDTCWAQPDAKAVNDRRFAHGLGFALPGTRVIESVEDLDGEWPEYWVAKAVWTAAGRDRALGEGVPTGETRSRVRNLVARCGAVVVEPWCLRVQDLGVTSFVGGEPNPPHTLIVDHRGAFVGIDLREPKLAEPMWERLYDAVAAADRALAAAGYRGPFTVDAFVYKASDGGAKLHAMCELNARYTFGHVARALAARRLGFGEPPPSARVLVDPPFTAWVE